MTTAWPRSQANFAPGQRSTTIESSGITPQNRPATLSAWTTHAVERVAPWHACKRIVSEPTPPGVAMAWRASDAASSCPLLSSDAHEPEL